MKKWQKVAVLALVPTATTMHSRWIAYLMDAPYAEGARAMTLGVIIVAEIAAAAMLGLFEGA